MKVDVERHRKTRVETKVDALACFERNAFLERRERGDLKSGNRFGCIEAGRRGGATGDDRDAKRGADCARLHACWHRLHTALRAACQSSTSSAQRSWSRQRPAILT